MNPRFTAHMVVHWVGPPVAAFALWEPLRTNIDVDRFDGYDGCEEAEFVYEAAVEMLMEDPIAADLKAGGGVVMSLAGVLNFYTHNTQDGVEHDMDVEIEWHHFRILSEKEVCEVLAAELDPKPAADLTIANVPFTNTFKNTQWVSNTANTAVAFQPFIISTGPTT